jgi:hypothetical protein
MRERKFSFRFNVGALIVTLMMAVAYYKWWPWW